MKPSQSKKLSGMLRSAENNQTTNPALHGPLLANRDPSKSFQIAPKTIPAEKKLDEEGETEPTGDTGHEERLVFHGEESPTTIGSNLKRVKIVARVRPVIQGESHSAPLITLVSEFPDLRGKKHPSQSGDVEDPINNQLPNVTKVCSL